MILKLSTTSTGSATSATTGRTGWTLSYWVTVQLVLVVALMNTYSTHTAILVEGWTISNVNSKNVNSKINVNVNNNNNYRSTARSTSIIRRQANVATEFLMSQIQKEEAAATKAKSADAATSTMATATMTAPKPKRKLPRSERKALEREKKKNNNKNNNNGKNNNKNKNNNKTKDLYKLHSTAVSQLTSSSTAEDVLQAIKRAQKLHDHHDLRVIANFLIDECDVGFAYGYRGSLLARLAVAALRWENHNVARRAIEIRSLEYRASMQPMESAAIIRGLLRVHNVTDALNMIADELSLPMDGTDLATDENHEKIKHRARSLASVASRNLFEGEPSMALLALQMMKEMGPMARQLTADELDMPWLRLLQGAAQCESKRRSGDIKCDEGLPRQLAVDNMKMNMNMNTDTKTNTNTNTNNIELPCNLAYSVLNAMSSFPSDNDDLVYEALSNALVRRVLFVTGAVDMGGLPPPDRGEAVFIGRSNVGKSSLVNMITNRKSLAYTSKTPGKTQQFNFFTVNDKPGREKEFRYGDTVGGEKDDDSFYLVDLPGFGYAKVPDEQKQKWTAFMGDYLQNRKNLKVVFHLIDSRHGPIDEDSNIMRQVGENLPANVAYVVVLTKADKNVKNSNKNKPGKVSIDVMNHLREVMRENKVGKAPVLLTSAEKKLGRDDIWRYLRRAAEGK